MGSFCTPMNVCAKCLNMKCDAMQVRWWYGIVSVCPMSHNIADRSHHQRAPDTGLHPAHPAHTTPPSIYVSINLHKVTKIYLLSIFCPV